MMGRPGGVFLNLELDQVAVLEPDLVLPDQYFHRSRVDPHSEPEKDLMRAVLEMAVLDYRRYALATNRRERRLFSETEEWFVSEETDWPFSFANICCALGLEADYVRAGLQRWRQERQVASSGGTIHLRPAA